MNGVIMSKKEINLFRHAMNVIEGRLSIGEFSLLINKSYRQAQRIIKKVKEKAQFGVIHGNTGKRAKNKTCASLIEEVLKLKQEHYFDFNLTHFKELLKEKEGLEIGYSTLYRAAKKKNLIKHVKRRRTSVHKLRPRLPREGMLVQFDGSEHCWFDDLTSTLIAGIDDATGKILSAQFFDGETSLNSMSTIQDIIEHHGIPEAFYMDEAAIFGKKNREWHSQIARAFETLDIKLILAGSAQAKGRVERLFRTLQDRLIAELNFVQVKTFKQANRYLKHTFIPKFNEQFSHPARESKTSFKSYECKDLKQILCRKEQRKIGSGNCFSYRNTKYILTDRKDYRFRTININTHQDQSISYDVMGKKVEVEIFNLKGDKIKLAG